MTRAELIAALARVGVTSGYYIDGKPPGIPDNSLHLSREYAGRWVVAHLERGTFNIFRYFDIEADACEYLFLMLVSDSHWSTRVRLTPEEKARVDAFRAERVARERANAAARIAQHEA